MNEKLFMLLPQGGATSAGAGGGGVVVKQITTFCALMEQITLLLTSLGF